MFNQIIIFPRLLQLTIITSSSPYIIFQVTNGFLDWRTIDL